VILILIIYRQTFHLTPILIGNTTASNSGKWMLRGGLRTLFRRNFMFNYQYGFNYNLTKSLKLNPIHHNNIVRNYLNQDNEPIDSFTIWDSYWDIH
jgi:hypothetical protein